MENKRKNYAAHRPYKAIQLKPLLLTLKNMIKDFEKEDEKNMIEIIEEIELRID